MSFLEMNAHWNGKFFIIMCNIIIILINAGVAEKLVIFIICKKKAFCWNNLKNYVKGTMCQGTR